jgi:hypothetical protein
MKQKRKKPVARTPEAVAKYKELFLKQLAKGRSPGAAARAIKIARQTAYNWKNDDRKFDAAWRDAVETGLDLLETKLYDSAMNGNSSDAQFILKHRRYGTREAPAVKSNFMLNITLQEQYKRLERLGLPVPVIETDYEEDNLALAGHP